MKWEQLQAEQAVWSTNNFGDQPSRNALLGIVEEMGELAHPLLKRTQGIRNNEKHDEKIKDAVADIVIYTLDFATRVGINIKQAYETMRAAKELDAGPAGDGFTQVFGASVCVGRLCKHFISEDAGFHYPFLENWVGLLLCRLENFCTIEGLDFQKTVWDVWNQVKQRDWTTNTATGR